MQASLPVSSLLRKAQRHVKAEEFAQATILYREALFRFPKNKKAIQEYHNLKNLIASQNALNSEVSQEQVQELIGLYEQGKFKEVLSKSKSLIHLFPKAVILYNLKGASSAALKKYDEAIETYKQVLKIQPEYADAYNNMANALQQKGDLDEAIESYKHVLKIQPEYAQAYTNMANALQQKGALDEAIETCKRVLKIKPDFAEAFKLLGDFLKRKNNLSEAIASYKMAIKIKPDYFEAHNNMGLVLQEQNELDAAIDSYKMAIKIKPSYLKAQDNLTILLTEHTPIIPTSNPTIVTHQGLRKIPLSHNVCEVITERHIMNIVDRVQKLLKDETINTETNLSQIYRRNSQDLNCERHMAVFNQHSIIPEFCFGCYKVQVEARSIRELLSVFLIFDQLELENNNTRKCMIEFRPKIPGFYKGYVYCRGIDEASAVSKYLNGILQKRIRPSMFSEIKRGCSEYPHTFPAYKEINISGPQLMNYNPKWKKIEIEHDEKFPIKPKNNIKPTLRGLSLLDCKILQNWFSYAKGIGDQSLDLKDENINFRSQFYEIGQDRLRRNQKQIQPQAVYGASGHGV